MNPLPHDDFAGRWSTASFGQPAGPSPAEIRSLGEHLHLCRLGNRLSALACAAQGLQGFVAAHLFTSLALALGLIGLVLGIAT